MIISENPRHIGFPAKVAADKKIAYIIKGRVSVGKFARYRNGNFIDFYLPRIRQMNFSANSRKFKHPGYKTADQAFAAGCILMKNFKN